MPKIQGGVWPAMLTPVTDAGEPNVEMIDRLVEVLIAEDLDGLYILGSTGQGPAFSVEARKLVTERVTKAVGGRVPVISHVGCVATADSVELAKHAAAVGVDGISSVPPIYYATSADGIFEHYRLIGGATDLPFFPYHHSMFGEAALADPTYTDRLMELPNIAGMKITVRDLYIFGLIHQRTGGRLILFSGADELICHATLSGSTGAIGSFYNVFGPTCRAARDATIAGNFEHARDFMARFQTELDGILRSGAAFSFIRSAMRLKYDVEIGPGRAPLVFSGAPWDDDEVLKVIAAIEASGD